MAATATKIGNIKGPKGDKGDPGQAGSNGTNGQPGASVLSGQGAPSASITSTAVAGRDSYLDLTTGDTYSFS